MLPSHLARLWLVTRATTYLAAAAMAVARLEPVETANGIVGPSLSGKQQRHPAFVGKGGRARSVIIALGRRVAAMQYDHERAVLGESLRDIDIRAQ